MLDHFIFSPHDMARASSLLRFHGLLLRCSPTSCIFTAQASGRRACDLGGRHPLNIAYACLAFRAKFFPRSPLAHPSAHPQPITVFQRPGASKVKEIVTSHRSRIWQKCAWAKNKLYWEREIVAIWAITTRHRSPCFSNFSVGTDAHWH